MTPEKMMPVNATQMQAPLASATADDQCLGPWEWTLLIFGIIAGIALLLFLIRKCVQGPFYRKKNRIDGKVVVITGCNTGIGKETALELASRGAKIYMACRDPVRCEGARLEIIEKTKNENIFNRTLDLGSLESIRKFADKFTAEEQRLDILINNAGVMATPKGETKDGFDMQLGTNHLGHFLLTNLLLDTLKQSAPSRIVVVTSAIYVFGKIMKEDLNSEKAYSKWGAYAQSKLANILFTVKLSEKLHGTNVTVNCCHPGLVKTELGRHLISGRTKSILDPVTSLFFKTPKAGAQTSIRLALDPRLEKATGGYYFDTIPFPVLPKAKNKEMAEWLWTVSEEMVGLRAKEQMTIVPVTLQVPPKAEVNGLTTVIEVEKVPSNLDALDNRKMEEGMLETNGNADKKDISEKMKKIMEEDRTEKMDEPEKMDKSEKVENEMSNQTKIDTSDMSEKTDIPEKIHKEVDNAISKISSEVGSVMKEVMEVMEEKAEAALAKIDSMKPEDSPKKNSAAENPDAIEKADQQQKEKPQPAAEKTDTPEKQI